MSKHLIPRTRTVRRLRVAACVVVVAIFLSMFVGGAVGLIGDDDSGYAGSGEGAGAGSGGSATAASGGGTGVRGVPAQTVVDSTRLKRTTAWLRRGLADDTTFRVATFNVLGDSHTAPGGNKGGGWASGSARMDLAYSLIQQADLDVIGFQEFETPQFNRFSALAGDDWDVFPGPTLDRGSLRDSIAWRTDTWELVEATSIGIPYFGGQIIRRPVVKLRNLESDREVWFFNTHNPASTPRWGNNARWRAAAIVLQTDLAKQLGEDGTPVVFTGDYNDREEAFCPLVGDTDLEAADGGTSADGSCVLPDSPGIDWIFGSKVQFSGYVSASEGIVGRVSDHPFVFAEGFIALQPLPGQDAPAEQSVDPSAVPSASP